VNVANLVPADGAERIAPGAAVVFDLESTGLSAYVEDFAGASIPAWWSRPSYSADVWDIYDDSGNNVLRAQGKGTLLQLGQWRNYSAAVDIYCRVKWHTGATAGIVARENAEATLDSVFAEIDSGGLRLGWYDDGSRNVDQTSAFSPSDATWYWIRLQVANTTGGRCRYRAKYWTGTKGSEPGGWSIAWDYPTIIKDGGTRNVRWGVHCHAGTAYFDDFEVLGMPDPADLAKLTVEINGHVCSVANGRLAIHVVHKLETFETAILYPDIDNWRAFAVYHSSYDGDWSGDQDVVIKWDGSGISTTTFSVARFPAAPVELSAAGDPDRLQPFRADGIPRSMVVEYLLVPSGADVYGAGGMEWTLSPFQLWRSYIDLEWFLAPPIWVTVGGEWWLAQPIRTVHPSSMVVGQPVRTVHPSSVVPEGNVGRHHPASYVVQGYVRKMHPGAIIAGVRFLYRGKTSGIVSVAFLERIKASGVVYEVNADNLIEVQVDSEATYQALIDAGITFS